MCTTKVREVLGKPKELMLLVLSSAEGNIIGRGKLNKIQEHKYCQEYIST
jgi:hypothetical protein